jgi:two-component system response regulator AtoC
MAGATVARGRDEAFAPRDAQGGMAMRNVDILFVDDERPILSFAEQYLTRQGYRVTVDDGRQVLDLIKKRSFDIVFTDMVMPGLSGLEVLAAVKKYRPETEVIIVTGHATIDSAIEAMKLGCYDYLQKPIELQLLNLLIERIVEKRKLKQENVFLKKRLKERYKYDELVGVSARMQEIYEIIDRIAMGNPTVLIQGESGTGKELVARVIAQNGERKGKPFIAVNCSAIVEGLLESELFGHVRGAFTGAIRDKMGLFRAAQGGTIFLDEVAEISPPVQAKLLRVLQERKVRPVGASIESDVDVRVIAATNRDLEEATESGALRKDLFYRLNVVSIKMPLLNERREDIPLLISHFLNKFKGNNRKKITGISHEAMDILLNYHWPGNVRELENVIERAFSLGQDEIIHVDDLPTEIRKLGKASEPEGRTYRLRENEIILVKKALRKTGGSKAQAAELLGINVATIYRKIKRYGLGEELLQNANM